MADNSYDFLVKLLVIGDSGVGKTNILLRACDDKFIASHLMTIGHNFYFRSWFQNKNYTKWGQKNKDVNMGHCGSG
jgi:GTPase SAR1 family protein